MVLDIAAAIVWAYYKNWGQVLYWSAAAVLTLAVTYMMGK